MRVDDVPGLVGMLRMSTKYQVSSLRRRAIDGLLRWYPPTLEEYNCLLASSIPLHDYPRHVLVANVAQETDVPVLLPTALLLCCATADAHTLYDGIECDGFRYLLTEANKRALFLGRPRLSHAARSRTQAFFWNPSFRNTMGECHRVACNQFCEIYSRTMDAKDDPWINPFRQVFWKPVRTSCCASCVSSWQIKHQQECREVWDELPSYFDLPSWSQLLKAAKGS